MHQIKAQKLDQLIGPQINSDSSTENLKTVVTIPENLLLSDPEKWILSKGFNFFTISEKTDEFSVKQDVEKFLRRVLGRELVLTLNCFSFGGNCYKQTNGVAIGTKMGPSYANLFVGFI